MSRSTTLTGPWLELADRVGGVSRLAAICGVTRLTVWRWARGDIAPDELRRRDVDARLRRRGLSSPFRNDH